MDISYSPFRALLRHPLLLLRLLRNQGEQRWTRGQHPLKEEIKNGNALEDGPRTPNNAKPIAGRGG